MENLLEEITSSKLVQDNYILVTQFCDTFAISKPKECVKAILRKVFSQVPISSLRALRLLDYCSNNAGSKFTIEMSSKEFHKLLVTGFGRLDQKVQLELIILLARLAEEYKSTPEYDIIVTMHEHVRQEHMDVYRVFMNQQHLNQSKMMKYQETTKEEQAELEKAIALSLKEGKTKTSSDPPEHRKSPVNVYESATREVVRPVTSGKGILKNTANNQVTKLRALYDFEAAEDNEVSFQEGEILTLIDSSDQNWWKGRNHSGQEGLFPAQFVTMLDASSMSADKTMTGEKQSVMTANVNKPATIEPDKIARCLEMINSIDPSQSQSMDPKELNGLEQDCRKMGPLIDGEIYMADKKMDQLLALETKLKDVLNLYTEVSQQSQQMQPPYSGYASANPTVYPSQQYQAQQPAYYPQYAPQTGWPPQQQAIPYHQPGPMPPQQWQGPYMYPPQGVVVPQPPMGQAPVYNYQQQQLPTASLPVQYPQQQPQ